MWNIDSAPPSVTRVTAVLAHSSGELLLLGTEGGHVFVVEVPGFREMEENNISVEAVQNRSDNMLIWIMNSCPKHLLQNLAKYKVWSLYIWTLFKGKSF